MEFAKRMDRFGEGIFSKLAEIKKEKKAKGEEIIDLSIERQTGPPAGLISQRRSARLPPTLRIMCMPSATGMSCWMLFPAGTKADMGWKLDPERGNLFLVLLGFPRRGLAHIALTMVDEGDMVLVPDPCYPVFGDGPQIAGANLYYMPQKKGKPGILHHSVWMRYLRTWRKRQS